MSKRFSWVYKGVGLAALSLLLAGGALYATGGANGSCPFTGSCGIEKSPQGAVAGAYDKADSCALMASCTKGEGEVAGAKDSKDCTKGSCGDKAACGEGEVAGAKDSKDCTKGSCGDKAACGEGEVAGAKDSKDCTKGSCGDKAGCTKDKS